jgi:hypothetical protein
MTLQNCTANYVLCFFNQSKNKLTLTSPIGGYIYYVHFHNTRYIVGCIFNSVGLTITREIPCSISCSFKFILKVGVEESIVNAPRITERISCLNLISLLALFRFLLCRLTSGAFTIDSSTPTLRINLNEHPMYYSRNV